jgi:adenylate cyclase
VFNGRLYQYVGDEVVLTWEWEEGLKHHQCISLYFAFMELIRSKSEKLKREFGLIPEFKAGIHGGFVTVAEVGDIKREIAYHGDVINTASRIQSKCNELQKSLLISSEIKKNLPENTFRIENMGEVNLRGKKEPVDICAIEVPGDLVKRPLEK